MGRMGPMRLIGPIGLMRLMVELVKKVGVLPPHYLLSEGSKICINRYFCVSLHQLFARAMTSSTITLNPN